MNEETLFHEARQKPVGERTAFLQQECGGDDALRARIESLLHADDNPASLLEPKLPATSASDSLNEAAGQMIGPYKLLQQIGEGGMGTVYMAEQSEPVAAQSGAQNHQDRHGYAGRSLRALRPSGRPWP